MTVLATQEAPYPDELAKLVNGLKYWRGWRFVLTHVNRGQGSNGLTLIITVTVPDSYHPATEITVTHYMLVPPASYNRRSWQRWLFDQIMLVHRHEAMEAFQIDGYRVFQPLHGPGNDPYLITELSEERERRTSFRGEVSDH